LAILNIINVNDDKENGTLRKKSRPVEQINARILQLLDDMKDTLRAANGIGLAAPQVGVLRRVVVVDNGEKILELINPEIVKTEGEQTGFEACLSVPGKYGTVKRPMRVTVKALDRNGNEFTVTGEELTARAFCHEIDHLNGVLYTDLASEVLDQSEVEEDE